MPDPASTASSQLAGISGLTDGQMERMGPNRPHFLIAAATVSGQNERGPDRTQQQRIIFARDWDQMSLGQHGQEEAVEEQLGQAASSGCDINFISRVGRNFHQSETGIGGGLQGNHAPANADSDARNA